MSMSSNIVAFREADEKWQRMKAVWEACEKANVPVPAEVAKFFNHTNPKDSRGMEIPIGAAIREWSGKYYEGYELDLTKLPEGVKIIRFYNSF